MRAAAVGSPAACLSRYFTPLACTLAADRRSVRDKCAWRPGDWLDKVGSGRKRCQRHAAFPTKRRTRVGRPSGFVECVSTGRGNVELKRFGLSKRGAHKENASIVKGRRRDIPEGSESW